jgi:hypothetical protein
MSALSIFVIGSAGIFSNYNRDNNITSGQLPTVTNVVDFITRHPDKKCHFYFIDPMHLYESRSDLDDNQNLSSSSQSSSHSRDQQYFRDYQLANLRFDIIPRYFRFETFESEFRLTRNDECLLIDYANVTASEYDFMSKFGHNYTKWNYWSPGCMGSRLDLNQAYKIATDMPKYSIYNETPVPNNLSEPYRTSLGKEIYRLTVYATKLTPGVEPPQWLIDDFTRDEIVPDDWAHLRESSLQLLEDFFKANKHNLYEYEPNKWYGECRKILGFTN